ncbi:hypothetical protein D3C85_1566900 [compost metagenome]
MHRIHRKYHGFVTDFAILLIKNPQRDKYVHIFAGRFHPQPDLHVAGEGHVFAHRLADKRNAGRPAWSAVTGARRRESWRAQIKVRVVFGAALFGGQRLGDAQRVGTTTVVLPV